MSIASRFRIPITQSIALSATLCLCGGAGAEILFVPLTSSAEDGTELEILVANPDVVDHTFEGAVVPRDLDALATAGTDTGSITVPALQTIVVNGPVGIGLWRITGPPALDFYARQRVKDGVGAVQVPVLSAASGRSGVFRVQSLRAVPGTTGTFSLINLSSEEGHCVARVFRANGQQLGPDFSLPFPPMAMRHFENIPHALAPGESVAELRVVLDCDQKFFAFARLINHMTGALSIITPSAALATGFSDIVGDPGGDPGGEPPPPSGDAFVFKRDTFFTSTSQDPRRELRFDVPADKTYAQLRMAFDFVFGGWSNSNRDGIHRIVHLSRDGTRFSTHTYSLLSARGPNRNLVRNEITIDLPRFEVIDKVKKGVSFVKGREYHVDYLWDGVVGVWELEIREKGGPMIVALDGRTTGPVYTERGKWLFNVGDVAEEAHARTPAGWTWRNIVIELRP